MDVIQLSIGKLKIEFLFILLHLFTKTLYLFICFIFSFLNLFILLMLLFLWMNTAAAFVFHQGFRAQAEAASCFHLFLIFGSPGQTLALVSEALFLPYFSTRCPLYMLFLRTSTKVLNGHYERLRCQALFTVDRFSPYADFSAREKNEERGVFIMFSFAHLWTANWLQIWIESRQI